MDGLDFRRQLESGLIWSKMSNTSEQRYILLRKRLDQFGYKQPLAIESLPLVEKLFQDLIHTTEALKKAKDVRSSSSSLQIDTFVLDLTCRIRPLFLQPPLLLIRPLVTIPLIPTRMTTLDWSKKTTIYTWNCWNVANNWIIRSKVSRSLTIASEEHLPFV